MLSIEEFTAQCEVLLERDGKLDSAIIDAFPRRDALVYRSPGLVILRGPGNDLEIDIRYFSKSEAGREFVIDNPVVCRNEKGELYRTHGEYTLAVPRLERLLANEHPEEPIRVGCVEGETRGLD